MLGGKEVSIESGLLARQSDGCVLVSSGEDKVLVTVVSLREESGLDFFPLTVEYQERFYSAGKIPGGFFRREGRPSYEATLISRMIDRPLRPCFPKGYSSDTQIVATALSYSGSFPMGILAGIGASSALHISDIPFKGPVGSVQVVKIGGELKLNPSLEEEGEASLNFIVSGTRGGLLMVEGEASFVSEEEALEALEFAHKSMGPLFDMQEELREKSGSVAKREWSGFKVEKGLREEIERFCGEKIKGALKVSDKRKRYKAFDTLKEETLVHVMQLVEEGEKWEKEGKVSKKPEEVSHFSLPISSLNGEVVKKSVEEVLGDLRYDYSRSDLLDTQLRIDGRKPNEVRGISCDVGFLPRVHGSGLFTRGETQVLGTVTLGTGDDEQKVDALSGFSKKSFLLHYNFPPYCVGETGRLGGQSRREIGHGFLAEKALKAVLPDHSKFPYTIRVVSEVLESNGSSSMGTVCSGSMALLDAGVPIKEPVAGIAMGLIQEEKKGDKKEGDKKRGEKGSKRVVILSDILGDEDHLGDMDFKVAGTLGGITALQMDIKAESLSFSVLREALSQAREGRLHILEEMAKILRVPREELSRYASRIEVMQIKPEKIREVIGSGGKVINKIIEDTGVKVNIEDTGKVYISSVDKERIDRAREIIEGICAEVEEGGIYEGRVEKLAAFGAFVEILPKTSGLLHISEISHRRIKEVSEVLQEGDKVRVKVLQVGDNGRIRLSRKALMERDN